jgi:predicted nucleic acid-binding protein
VNYYFDTSALCRYYHWEPGSDKVQALVDDPDSHCIVSYLTVLETYSAFAAQARSRVITKTKLGRLRTKFKTDIAQRRFRVVRALRRHFDHAAVLIERYGLTQRLRSLDALHLAIAIDLQTAGSADVFVTADKSLEAAAISEGLRTVSPLTP